LYLAVTSIGVINSASLSCSIALNKFFFECCRGRPNGCELSGRGWLPHMRFQETASPLSLASAAASPVRSSELLCARFGRNDCPRYRFPAEAMSILRARRGRSGRALVQYRIDRSTEAPKLDAQQRGPADQGA
jgi:hypothetical protein